MSEYLFFLARASANRLRLGYLIMALLNVGMAMSSMTRPKLIVMSMSVATDVRATPKIIVRLMTSMA
jgi:hypothetical protein